MEAGMDEGYRVHVELKAPDDVCYSGEKLSGCVTLVCEKPITITGVELRLRGGAKVHWSHWKGRFPNRTEVVHHAEESYFDEKLELWGHECNSPKAPKEELGIGKHMFPFSWLIPSECPSSCEGPLGWIRYSAHANVISPSQIGQLKSPLLCTKHFTIIRHVDLNYEKGTNAGIREQRDMVLHTAFCRPGEVSCTLGLARSGFVPGEIIRPDVQINNIFPGKIKESSLALKQTIYYGVDGHSRTVGCVVRQVRGGKIKPGRVSHWENRGIVIPPLPPSRLDGSKFIKTSYEINFHLDLQSHSITIIVPITIGTLPHSDVNLDTWGHGSHVIKKWQNDRKKDVKSGFSLGTETTPKYRVYHVATKSTRTVSLDFSPGERRRSGHVTLDLKAQESFV